MDRLAMLHSFCHLLRQVASGTKVMTDRIAQQLRTGEALIQDVIVAIEAAKRDPGTQESWEEDLKQLRRLVGEI